MENEFKMEGEGAPCVFAINAAPMAIRMLFAADATPRQARQVAEFSLPMLSWNEPNIRDFRADDNRRLEG